jgi:hypothetical protein
MVVLLELDVDLARDELDFGTVGAAKRKNNRKGRRRRTVFMG